jgi:hypothetical protein
VKPRLLDLFCGAGGAAMGYQRAGFHVTGVDIRPQPHYAGDEFIQADAMTYPLGGFDVIHASPPCQFYSAGTSDSTKALSPALIDGTRARLEGQPAPWVMENVMGAKHALRGSLLLCGTMFGLPIMRHRIFETPVFMWAPEHPKCNRDTRLRFLPDEHRPMVLRDPRALSVTGHSRFAGSFEAWREWMQMPWAQDAHEVTEAIPPAYTTWIGEQLLAAIEVPAA